MIPTTVDNFEEIVKNINDQTFNVPLKQDGADYFPSYLEKKLAGIASYFVGELSGKIGYLYTEWSDIIDSVKKLITVLPQTVHLYYQGRIQDAYTCFVTGLESVKFAEVTTTLNLPRGNGLDFYRGRYANSYVSFAEKDLFHIPFEERGKVSTNRFSIPGLPALYLSDSIYTVWEEMDREKLNDIWFSKFSIQASNILVVQLEKLADLCKTIAQYPEFDLSQKLHFLKAFFITFPLTLASSIEVKDKKANFKPEYIIPQMLSQYVAKSGSIAGIKFLSTKIDYSKIENVRAYNYVFPVKQVNETGYCPVLAEMFHLSAPTSLEFEMIMSSVMYKHQDFDFRNEKAYFELVHGEKFKYSNSSFGKLEAILRHRGTKSVI